MTLRIGPSAASAQTPSAAEQEELKKAAQAFEAVFLRQMIGSMRQASLGNEIFGNSATDQFRELSDARLADEMAETEGFGIARMLLAQFGPKEGEA